MSRNFQAVNEAGREIGVVKRFSLIGGYGFIRPGKGGEDVFVNLGTLHRSGIERLDVGMVVEYRRIEEKGRYRAVELKVIEKISTESFSQNEPHQISVGEAAPDPEQWIEGSIKWFDPVKGFGFVQFLKGHKDAFLPKYVLEKGGIDTACRVQDLPVRVKIFPGKEPGLWQVQAIALM